MKTWIAGPVAHERSERHRMAKDLCDRALVRFQALATGVYGSVARGDDGPYSDIEAIVVVPGAADETFEWIHDGWKLEVDVCGLDALVHEADEVAPDWAVTHANFLDVVPVHDPDGVFADLAGRVIDTPQSRFDRAITRLLVDGLYEPIGKLRNARASGDPPPPGFIYYVAKLGSWLMGLANRRTYPTASRALEESLVLNEQIPGYEALCRMAMAGDVQDAGRVFEACEAFWLGTATWAHARGLTIESPAHLV